MPTTDDTRLVRAAQNQSLFREINERIKDLNEAFNELVPLGEWVCECDDAGCVERMELTLPEYQRIRESPDRFPVLPGHEDLDVEVVVETHDRYVVVEKIGAGKRVAIENDPRAA